MIDSKVIETALKQITQAKTEADLEQLRVSLLGRKGVVTQELRLLGDLPAQQRAKAGQAANQARITLSEAIIQAKSELKGSQLDREVATSQVDLTVPSGYKVGHLHPVSRVNDELIRIFWQMGYEVAEGPEIETDWYNFEALNLPADHPARDMQDTFYLEGSHLPRTHTSSVQIRYMEQHQPPIRIIAPGKTYRNEDEDSRHSWMFQQIEGLVVDEGISVSDLKGTLLVMLKGLLGDEVEVRLRPGYFPYTEPSIEFDVSCVICNGKGCNTCSQTGWLELGGSGMVHPQVLKNVEIDPNAYSGFAFGFGLERIALVKYQVPDIREFWRPNLRFLEQF